MEASQTAEVQADDIAPVTDTGSAGATKSETTTQAPRVEVRDGKTYVDGIRVYSRDDTSKIAANAKNEALNGVLRDLDVDSLEQVKDVISTLKTTPLTEDGSSSLDVKALKQAVAKREATVEELQNEVQKLRTDLLLKDHLGNLQSAMPSGWNSDQKTAVLDLMKARNMFAIEDNSFQLRNGEDFLTVDGERPDYGSAVELVGKSLGLPFGKKGVDVVNTADSGNDGTRGAVKPLDQSRIDSDPEYRAAYTHVRKYNPSMSRNEITHNIL
jgi:hypothetical protein